MKETRVMIRSIRRPLLPVAGALTVALTIPVAHADDAPPVGWTGQVQAGVVLARGTLDTTTANMKFDATDTYGQWKDIAHLAYLYGESGQVSSAQRLEGLWQTNYDFTKRAFVFGSINGEDDHFDGFVYQVTLATGVGYKFIDTDTTKLTGNAGVGYRRLQTETLAAADANGFVARTRGPQIGDAVGTAGLDYAEQLTKTTKLTDKLLIQSGSLDTAVANDVALAVNMTRTLALSVGWGVRYNSAPPAGTKSTNQLFTLNVVYSFNPPPPPK
jgi:putative salt-induced outer membrane protein